MIEPAAFRSLTRVPTLRIHMITSVTRAGHCNSPARDRSRVTRARSTPRLSRAIRESDGLGFLAPVSGDAGNGVDNVGAPHSTKLFGQVRGSVTEDGCDTKEGVVGLGDPRGERLAVRGGSAPCREREIFRQIKAPGPRNTGSISGVRQRRAGGKDPLSSWYDFRHGLLGRCPRADVRDDELRDLADLGEWKLRVER